MRLVTNGRKPAMTSGGLVKLSFQLPPDEFAAVQALASEHGRTFSAEVRHLLRLGMAQQERIDKIADAAG
jgi:hypothetical protein